MQFIDLKAQQALIRNKIDENIKKVLDHGKYINGPEVSELEEKLAAYCNTKYAIGCASGTDALLMALMALGIGPGDAVFTTPFTFIATAEVIQLLGAKPIFADIDEKTYNIDPEKLEEVIKATITDGKYKPKAIIPVDLFGQLADYDEINEIAKKYNLTVIEDSAQSFGGEYKNQKACSLAELATTSFFPAKPLGCYGDGGMIFTGNQDLYEKMISIRIHGKGKDKYDNVRIGINGRIDTIQCAILLAKFELYEKEIELRQNVADFYSDKLKDSYTIPFVKEYNKSVWAQYCILDENREKIQAKLKENNIPTNVYYPKPLHLQTAFKDLKYKKGDFPISEKISNQIFALPMYPYIDKTDQIKIIECLLS